MYSQDFGPGDSRGMYLSGDSQDNQQQNTRRSNAVVSPANLRLANLRGEAYGSAIAQAVRTHFYFSAMIA
jgi:hypothetical protein